MNQGAERKIAELLRMLADQVEKNPDLLRTKQRPDRTAPEINPFDLASRGGESLLREELGRLDTPALKLLIRAHGFDSSRLAERWKSRPRLIELIIRRTMALNSKGNVFL